MRTLFLALSLLAALHVHAQSSYTTGFEPPAFAPGNVNGQGGWGHLSNSPTGGDIVLAPVHGGIQSLAFKTRDRDFFGVASHLYSASLAAPAGESGSILTGTGGPVADPLSHFAASLWYRTPDAPVVSFNADGRVAELNPASRGPAPTDPVSRYVQVRTINSGDGRFIAQLGWYTTTGTFDFNRVNIATLNPGQWYRFDYLIHFVDGLNGTAPNDRVVVRIFDAGGALVGSACGFTWEAAWKSQPTFGSGLQPLAVNGFDFWAWANVNGTVVGHVDDFSMSSFDEPALGILVNGAANVCFGGTTLLSSILTGAAASFEWRDGTGALVATTPSFNAGAGTYTLTVTNSLCETATSAPLTITQNPQLQASISGRNFVSFPADLAPLTATASGGSGSYASFTWRNAQNDVVGTGPTFSAPAGTYTVTVTDATCGAATSPAFTVVAYSTPTVPTAGEWGLLALALGLALVAFVRMQN